MNPVLSVAPWRIVYAWYIECPNGQSSYRGGNSHQVTAAELGCGLGVDFAASKAGYAPFGDSSFNRLGRLIPVADAANPAMKHFSKARTPRITRSAKVGKKLTVHTAAWSPRATLHYRWLQNGTPIAGATRSTYRVQPADLATKISVMVTGTRTGTRRSSGPPARRERSRRGQSPRDGWVSPVHAGSAAP